MQEIEVKARIKDIDSLVSLLEKKGCTFSAPIHQIDTVYIPRGKSIPVGKGENVLRIRKQNDKYILTLKQTVTNQLDCIEKETYIEDPHALHEILLLLGFVETSTVEKTRRTARLNEYEICIDQVADLGNFIEVETFGT